ncbi:hypothetical protein [Hydrogenophaga sp. MI9]|uniref:hypothetical protein n=1 Tax=Hydrogenophaga sp. MI9 TaxID=3453719 RepID=UPI003EEB8A48
MATTPRTFAYLSRVLAGVGLTVLASATQAADAQVNLRPHWAAGSQVSYAITKTRAKQGKVFTDHSKVLIRVAEASDNGFLLRVEEPMFPDQDIESEKFIAGNGLSTTKLALLEVSPDGEVQRVRNWEDLRTEGLKALELLSDHLQKRHGPDPMIDQAVAHLKQRLSTEEDIKATVLRDIGLLFQPLGLDYSADEPIEISVPTREAAPGLQFQGQTRATLKSLDNDKGLATIQWDQSYQIKAAEDFSGKPTGMPGEAFAGGLPMSGHITDEFVMDLRSGWPTRLTNTQTTVASDGSTETKTKTFTAE